MNLSKCVKGLLPVAALALAVASYAGNVPQYSFLETRDGFNFEYLENATTVNNIYGVAAEIVFKDKQTINAYKGEGFPIGFDFRYAGQEFNQFAIDNNGYILLGKDNVDFRGYANLLFDDASRYASNSFYMGLGPAMHGIKSGDLSYATTGDAGNRVTTIQFAHLNINETSPRGNAIYSLQIQLFENDSKVVFNFLEEESPYSSLSLIAGLCGWSNEDDLLLTSSGLGETAHVSPEHYANMLTRNACLHWSADDILGDPDEGHENPYQFSFTFEPTGTADFVCQAPTDLEVSQKGDVATVSCMRPADAPATVILISENPILDLPVQGVTYPVMNDAGEYLTTFNGATLIYYSNDEQPTAEFDNIKASTRYYIKAMGVNGYPSYSYDTSADLEFMSSHPAPYILQASSADGAINVKSIGDDPVIIAATLDRINRVAEGATGIFGDPAVDAKVGDEIEGGGTIIYVGDPGEFTYTDATPNRQTFFRAWSLRDGRVSKTFINATGVTNPEMPYKPQLELYTLYESPLNWITQTTHSGTTVTTIFMPRTRGVNDEEPVVGGISASGTKSTLISPVLSYGKNAVLSFEWAMETAREVSDPDAMVVLPEGNEPGVFGAGHSFTVSCGPRGTENELFTATEYNGTMTPSPSEPDRFISGTSQFLPISVNLPELEKARIAFSFSTEGFSILYLRNICVTGESGVVNLLNPSGDDIISAGKGSISILSAAGGMYEVVSIDGHRVASLDIPAGEGRVITLPAGIYVVGDHKLIVK